MLLSVEPFTIAACARSSPLSLKQTEEIARALASYYPHISFETTFVETLGDRDLKTSLRDMDSTDFFTRELDQMVLKGECRIAIHSAKDLPNPLPKGLAIIAITEGIDPSDALVLRDREALENLPPGAIIATSSVRRESAVTQLRPDLAFTDIRGNIGSRLAALDEKRVDGVVIAEAALIRLELTHRNRIILPGATAALQGKLAIIARVDDPLMSEIFSCLDSR